MDLLFEWFSQPLNWALLVIDLAVLITGIRLGLRMTRFKQRITFIMGCFFVCLLAILTAPMSQYFIGILFVFASGFSILLCIGALIGFGIHALRKGINKF